MTANVIFTPATEHTETDLMVARVNLGSVAGLVHLAECGRVAEQTAWYSRSSGFGFSGLHSLASCLRDAAALVDAVSCECWPAPFTYCEMPDGRHHHAPRSDADAKVAVVARIENARWFPALWAEGAGNSSLRCFDPFSPSSYRADDDGTFLVAGARYWIGGDRTVWRQIETEVERLPRALNQLHACNLIHADVVSPLPGAREAARRRTPTAPAPAASRRVGPSPRTGARRILSGRVRALR